MARQLEMDHAALHDAGCELADLARALTEHVGPFLADLTLSHTDFGALHGARQAGADCRSAIDTLAVSLVRAVHHVETLADGVRRTASATEDTDVRNARLLDGSARQRYDDGC